MSYEPLTVADVGLDGHGRLHSPRYGDVYHSISGALGQAVHVFLRGNGLPERWRGRSAFTVCETGFGLGLNFLTLWQAWRDDPLRSRRLHMVSIEAHPFTRDEIRCWLASQAPAPLRALAERLVGQWPARLPGLHRLEFEGGAVTLTLAFGQANAMVPRLSVRADAFFLDGFAPDRNPEMWSVTLLRGLARLATPGATVATWTSAGHVRRALVDAGFAVSKQPGYGGKWQMMVGSYRSDAARDGSIAAHAGGGAVIVIGGGLAGAGVAQALALRGCAVTVIDPAFADGPRLHAGHVAAAQTPLVARDDNPRARLARAGSQRALARWRGLAPGAAPVRCGTLQLERDAGRMANIVQTLDVLGFPLDWVRVVDGSEAAGRAGMSVARGGVFFADGLLVRPTLLIDALLATAGVHRLGGRASQLRRAGERWRVLDAAGATLAESAAVVVANAAHTVPLLQDSGLLEALPRIAQMHALAGEITLVPAGALAGGPRCIVGGEGYLLPAVDGWCAVGGTYDHGAQSARISAAGQETTLAKAAALLGVVPPDFASLRPGTLRGWAGWRAVLPGRLPAVGPLPHAPGLWLATGYASRGLTWAALAGDLIAAQLFGEPLPLEADLVAVMAPR